jgi:hypothetical protein
VRVALTLFDFEVLEVRFAMAEAKNIGAIRTYYRCDTHL